MEVQKKPRPFFGWIVVGATSVMAAFGWGIGFHASSVILQAVNETNGWPIEIVSTALTLHFLFGAFVVTKLPALHARFGIARVTFTGAVALAIGLVGWGFAAEIWHIFLFALFSGGGWVMLAAATVNAIIASWFVVKRPKALSLAYNGASIGGVIFIPLLASLSVHLGFPTATLVIAAILVATMAVLAAKIFRHTPESLGQFPDGEEPVRISAPSSTASSSFNARPYDNRRFNTLAVGMALSLFAQVGLLAHLFSILAAQIDAELAGLMTGAATASAILGRTLVGWLMPVEMDRRIVIAISHAVQALGAITMAISVGIPIGLIIGIVLFGAGVGNATSIPPLIAQAEFSREDSARVVPRIIGLAQGCYAFAPMSFGFARSTFDNDTICFAIAAVIQVMAIVTYLSGRKHAKESRKPNRFTVF